MNGVPHRAYDTHGGRQWKVVVFFVAATAAAAVAAIVLVVVVVFAREGLVVVAVGIGVASRVEDEVWQQEQ